MTRTVGLTLIALLVLLTGIMQPALAQRGRGFRAPRITAPRTPGLNTPTPPPSARPLAFGHSRSLPVNSYRRYSSYRSPNGFANVLPWFFLWSAVNNSEPGSEGVAIRVVGLNYGAVFTVVLLIIVLVRVLMLFVGIRRS